MIYHFKWLYIGLAKCVVSETLLKMFACCEKQISKGYRESEGAGLEIMKRREGY
jgi:hypothetical protein